MCFKICVNKILSHMSDSLDPGYFIRLYKN